MSHVCAIGRSGGVERMAVRVCRITNLNFAQSQACIRCHQCASLMEPQGLRGKGYQLVTKKSITVKSDYPAQRPKYGRMARVRERGRKILGEIPGVTEVRGPRNHLP